MAAFSSASGGHRLAVVGKTAWPCRGRAVMGRLRAGLWVIAVGLSLTSGCATTPAVSPNTTESHVPPPVEAASEESLYWWYARFRLNWPEDRTYWENRAGALALAHAVVKPVLIKNEGRIRYWRFHRRAARTESGHQFSFIFYARPQDASVIFEELRGSARLEQLRGAGVVEAVRFDETDSPGRPDISDTSDGSWEDVVQRQWPLFIMGVSGTWLGLIDEAVGGDPGTEETIEALLDTYRQADEAVNATWRSHGQHAFLHHLNALFGYEPIEIRF